MALQDGKLDRRRALKWGGGVLGSLVVGSTLAEQAQAHARMGAPSVSTAQAATVDWAAVARAAGGPGQMSENGVYRVDLSRTDIKATLRGIPIQPDLGMDGEAYFKQFGSTTMVMSELALLQREVWPVVQGLMANGFSVSAVHNHLIEMSPPIMFVHLSGMGDPVQLATALRRALSASGTPVSSSAPKKFPAIDVRGIERVFGRPGQVTDQVFQVDIPRTDRFTMNGMVIPPSMGMESTVFFQSAGGGRAAAQAELILLAEEVNPVLHTLGQHGIEVMALHNHHITESPRAFYMHAWAVGNAVTIASGVLAALKHTRMSTM